MFHLGLTFEDVTSSFKQAGFSVEFSDVDLFSIPKEAQNILDGSNWFCGGEKDYNVIANDYLMSLYSYSNPIPVLL